MTRGYLHQAQATIALISGLCILMTFRVRRIHVRTDVNIMNAQCEQVQLQENAVKVEIQTDTRITTKNFAANSWEHHPQPLDVASSR